VGKRKNHRTRNAVLLKREKNEFLVRPTLFNWVGDCERKTHELNRMITERKKSGVLTGELRKVPERPGKRTQQGN